MRVVTVILVVLLGAFQFKAWSGDAGHLAAAELSVRVAEQRERTEALAQRNRVLTAEVLALKQGLAAVESRARRDLGMIRAGETFYLVPDDA